MFKELRETGIWLKIIERKPLCLPERMESITSECNELIAIFVASVKKASLSLSDNDRDQ
jgi:hypothetical protein